MGSTFLWGLKRSGIHLIVNWLYANLGGTVKDPLDRPDLPRQLQDGFRDDDAGVAFFNNCGWFWSRHLELGPLTPGDLMRAAARQPTTIFGIEDCALSPAATTTAAVPAQRNVLLLRDPLNNLASRREGSKTRLGQFRFDDAFLDLYAEYCNEFLGKTEQLSPKTLIAFDRFIDDRVYRDAIAAELGVPNHDEVTEVSPYGDGSSFTGGAGPSSVEALRTRYRQHPLPRVILDGLLARPAIGEACLQVFGYDLADLVAAC